MCRKLVEVVKKFDDIEFLIAELGACDDEPETIDDLIEYLESELSYAN